jgi:hypothetical protein
VDPYELPPDNDELPPDNDLNDQEWAALTAIGRQTLVLLVDEQEYLFGEVLPRRGTGVA